MNNELSTFSKQNLEKLRALRLHGMAKAYENQLLNESNYSQVAFDDRFHDLILREECSKQDRAYNRLLKQADLKYVTSFEELHFTPSDGVSVDMLHYLTSGNWFFISKANIIIQGPCGTGKTALACCLLNNMAKQGLHVRFLRTGDLCEAVNIYQQNPLERKKYLDKLVKYEILALDDFGASPFNEPILCFLFDLIDRRLPSRPIIITSQKGVMDYRLLLGGDSRAEGMVDRLTKPSKVITLTGDSKRHV